MYAPPVLHDGGLGLDVGGDAAHVGHQVAGALLLLLLSVHGLGAHHVPGAGHTPPLHA